MIDSTKHNATFLELNRRQTTWLIAGTLSLMCLAFLVGYFWGQHNAIEQWLEETENQRFGDHIYSALYTRYNSQEADDADDNENTDESDDVEKSESQETKPTIMYYAQLIGYKASQKKDAERFVASLKKQGINAVIREHSSRKRGRTIIWYQVITDQYRDKQALSKDVALIKQQYKLHDIRIVEEPIAS